MRTQVRIYLLALRYWLQGDRWHDAMMDATIIVMGFNKLWDEEDDDE